MAILAILLTEGSGIKPGTVQVDYPPACFAVSEWVDAGRVVVESQVDPPSLQAKGTTTDAYRTSLANAVAQRTSRLFTHDVEVVLIWYISEERRYQTHIVADLDNVLKPTIDALVGPEGVLLDDNQVQSIKASWMTGATPCHRGFQLTIEALNPDESLPRGGKFVEITPSRCFYVPAMPQEAQRSFARRMAHRFEQREKAAANGMPEDLLRMLDPIPRSFPRARLARFQVLQPNDFR